MHILGFEKLIYHYDKLEKIKNQENQFPVHMTLSLGNYCNHKCLWCTVYAAQQNTAQQIDSARLLTFLDKASKRGLRAVGYVGNGEPTAHKDFAAITDEVHKLGLEQGMFTNAYLIDRYMDRILSNFTYMRVSLDAGTRETHDKTHDVNGQFDKIIANIRDLVKQRKNSNPTIGIQFAAHQVNLHDLHESVGLACDIGVDYFSVKPVFNRGAIGVKLEKNELTHEELSSVVAKAKEEFETADFEIYFRPFQILSNEEERYIHPYKKCYAASFNLNVYEDGRLVGCGPHQVTIGNMEDDFDEIEDRILELSDKLDLSKCPAGCRYHALNHIVDTVLDTDRAAMYHNNFL
jgi:MoaA/NifB/PqqE/SkfB family radical SAM enzyme